MRNASQHYVTRTSAGDWWADSDPSRSFPRVTDALRTLADFGPAILVEQLNYGSKRTTIARPDLMSFVNVARVA